MRRVGLSIAAAGLALVPSLAQAHLVATGIGPLYDGITHFGLSPEDYLPVIALAFLAGLRGPSTSRVLLAALPLAWFAGGLAAMAGAAPPAEAVSIATAVLFLAIGGALAANVQAPPITFVAGAVCLGLLRGLADLSGAGGTAPHLATLLGMVASVFVVVALAVSITLPLTRLWMIVAVRVSGSWLAAAGLLLAGWVWRYGARIG